MKKILLDMDTGVDDALAIALTAAAEKAGDAQLIGITTCFGNVENTTAVRNSLSILSALGRTDVPVFPGSDRALAAKEKYIAGEECFLIHGHDGIGDAGFPLSEKAPETTDSVDFILQAAEKYGAELTLVPTGPLTNVAHAIQRDKKTFEKIGRIVLMGGALAVKGNVSPYAEANISNDPEAAKIVLESGIPMTMIGLDVTHKTRIYSEETARWKTYGVTGTLFAEMTDYYIAFNNHEGCSLHDPLAAAEAIWPGTVGTLPFTVKVETESVARGRTYAVSYPDEGDSDHVQVGLTVSKTAVPLFKALLEEMLLSLG